MDEPSGTSMRLPPAERGVFGPPPPKKALTVARRANDWRRGGAKPRAPSDSAATSSSLMMPNGREAHKEEPADGLAI